MCSNTTLDVLPIALNTRIKHIRMSQNKIRVVDASFQFYEHLLTIDLSSNIIEDIEDRSFAAQAALQRLALDHNRLRDLSDKVPRPSPSLLQVFLGLARLTALSLRGNLLTTLPPALLAPMPSLER